MEKPKDTAILLKTRPSIYHYLVYFAAPLLVFLFSGFLANTLLYFWLLELLVLLFVVLMIFWREYRVTNKTFEVKYIGSPMPAGVPLEEIKGIELRPRFFFQRWFNTANVNIYTVRPDGLVFELKGIENPEAFKKFIYSLRSL